MRVTILGCGPAGLMAAHAVRQELPKAEIYIYSETKKSVISGAQYLHEAIPGLTSPSPDGIINFVKHGTRAGYATKLYGSPDAPCSWDAFDGGPVQAWQLDKVYDELWDRFSILIEEATVEAFDMIELLEDNDLVISAIPKPAICVKPYEHEFHSREIWISDYNNLPYEYSDNVILYNGDPLDHWYRASRLFGHDSTESTDPMAGAVRGIKPLGHTCNCWSGKVACVGRFGRWEKGVLVNHAYRNAIEACRALQPV